MRGAVRLEAGARHVAAAARRRLCELEDVQQNDGELVAQGAAVVGVHACGRRTDLCLEAAMRAGGPVAVMPCCYVKAPRSVPKGVRETLGDGLATDVGRSYRLQDAGYQVDWHMLPQIVTQQNRLLL